ncbi:MAG: sporulation transcription factor Spo0A [Bacillota bacterium]
MGKTTSVAIIDDNKQFCQLIKEHLLEFDTYNVTGIAHDGKEAIELIEQERPDLLLLDLIIPQIDGLGVLEAINEKSLSSKMKVIVLTSFGQEDVNRKISDLGADYIIMKPFELDLLTDRMDFLINAETDKKTGRAINLQNGLYSNSENDPVETENDIKIIISNTLHELGVPAHIKGYIYLREAIYLVIEEIDLLGAVTKQLYPRVAETFDSTPSRVERAIRHAIDVVWEKGNKSGLEEYFGSTITSSRGRPTNSQFIAKVADQIRLKIN